MAKVFQMQKKDGDDYVKVTFIENGSNSVQIFFSNDPKAAKEVTKDEAFDFIVDMTIQNKELEYLGSCEIKD